MILSCVLKLVTLLVNLGKRCRTKTKPQLWKSPGSSMEVLKKRRRNASAVKEQLLQLKMRLGQASRLEILISPAVSLNAELLHLTVTIPSVTTDSELCVLVSPQVSTWKWRNVWVSDKLKYWQSLSAESEPDKSPSPPMMLRSRLVSELLASQSQCLGRDLRIDERGGWSLSLRTRELRLFSPKLTKICLENIKCTSCLLERLARIVIFNTFAFLSTDWGTFFQWSALTLWRNQRKKMKK